MTRETASSAAPPGAASPQDAAPHALARQALRAAQLASLRALVAAALEGNAFYAPRLRAAGLGEPPASLDAFTAALPPTRKQELVEDQLAHPPYGTNLSFPLERYTRFNQTSGTAGAPLRWLDTPESWAWMVENWTHVLRAAGVGPGDRVCFAFSFGPFLGFWTAFEAAARLGCLCLPGGGLSSAARLRLIFDNAATVLCCTPTYALRLAEVAMQEQFDLAAAPVRRIIVAGEPGGSIPATRAAIETLWPGARVFDHHGMTEVGPVSYECPARAGRLHVIERAYFAEVLDPERAAPAVPGETGELLLTTLGRAGSPLLRYRTGDLVRPGAPGPCECGTHDLALEGGILGRLDDMVVVRGVNVWPGAVEAVVRGCGGIAEFAVDVVTGPPMTELRVTIEPLPGQTGSVLAHRLEQALRAALALRVPVELAAPGTLPRFEMKARRWRRVPAQVKVQGDIFQ